MIFKALQSELLRFKFYSLGSKIIKIPEFNLLMILNECFSILEATQVQLLQLSNGPTSNVLPILNVNVSGLLQLSLLVNNVLIPMVSLLAWVILAVHSPSNKEEKTFFSEMFHGDTANAQLPAIQQSTQETLFQQFIHGLRLTPVSKFIL